MFLILQGVRNLNLYVNLDVSNNVKRLLPKSLFNVMGIPFVCIIDPVRKMRKYIVTFLKQKSNTYNRLKNRK